MKRYCQHCGEESTKKSDHLFVCPNGHEDWINPAVGAVVFVLKDDEVLFGVRGIGSNKGKLSLPGGFVDVGESAEDAARREVKEEMGVEIEPPEFLGTYPTKYSDGRPILNVVFIARLGGGSLKPGDDMKGGEPVWRSLDDLPSVEEVAWAWYEKAAEDLRARLKRF